MVEQQVLIQSSATLTKVEKLIHVSRKLNCKNNGIYRRIAEIFKTNDKSQNQHN